MTVQPLILTEEEKDMLLVILLEEVNKVDNITIAHLQKHLKEYKQSIMEIYKKVVDNVHED